MRVEELLEGKLKVICQKLFPEHEIEITNHGGVGMWPYILDTNGREIRDTEIAQQLIKYAQDGRFEDAEEFRALCATRHCLEAFIEGGLEQIEEAHQRFEIARRERFAKGRRRK